MQSHKRTFLKSISFSYLYIFVYLFTGIFTTPLLLNHFQADYFALLMLVYAIITYLNNIRFGLPESLATIIAKSKDSVFNILIVKRTFFLLFLIVFITVILFLFTEVLISDWRAILGDVYALDKKDVMSVFYILIIFALFKIPFDLSLSVFIGFHHVYLEKIYKIINLIVNFLLVLFVVYNNESIVFFSIWAGLLDLLVSVISFVHIILRYDVLNVNVANKKISSMEIVSGGMLFFQLSITQAIIWGTGILLVSHMLALQDVTVYSLNMKIYVYIFYAFTIVNTVIAPLYGKYFASNSWEDIRKVFNIMILLLPFLGGVIWIATLYFMSDVITIWAGSIKFYIGIPFVFFMGFFFYLTGYLSSFITLLYSIGEIKSIIPIRWKEVIVYFFISIISVHFFGLLGVAIGMALSVALVPIRYLPKYIQSKSHGEISLNFTTQKKHFIFILLPSILVAFLVTSFIKILLIKAVVFIIMFTLYITFSWFILTDDNKLSILNLINYKKGSR